MPYPGLPTQQKMLRLLSDGKPHSREELHACLYDDLSPISNIKPHLSRLRRSLRERGEDIVCVVYNRTIHYQRVRLIRSRKRLLEPVCVGTAT